MTPPACPPREPVPRGDPHDAVGGLRAIERTGRGSLHDLEARDLLGIEVVDAGRLLAAGVDRQRLAVVLDPNAIHVVNRLVAEREAGLAPDANPPPPPDRTPGPA